MEQADNILEYKGYKAEIHYDAYDHVIYGIVVGIRDSVSFHSESAIDIVEEFHSAIDDYIEMCRANSVEPDRSFC